jgi:uncharacterized membrane protein
MVLEIRAPEAPEVGALRSLIPVLLSYLLRFVFVGIYWNNHHHLLQVVDEVDGRILWANLHLLFWLSLVPFVTSWMGETHFASWPVALYGVDMIGAAIAYFILTRALLARHGPDSRLAEALGADRKGKLSILLYLPALPLAFLEPLAACALYALVALMWLVPDRRIEKVLTNPG